MANSTVNLPTKSLMARLVSCRVVLWALDTHGPRLVEIFHGRLGQALPEDMREFFEQHLKRLQEVLSVARDLLLESERGLRDQKAKTGKFRKSRDEAFKALNPHVKGIKDIFRGACGDTEATDLGFSLRMPERAADLQEQAEHLVDRLSSPQELPVIRYRGVDLDPAAVVEEMRPLVERLGVALEELTREERQSEAMKIAKDEAIAAYDRSFLWAAGSAESLFKLAGLPEIAKRVRPSSRRSGVTDEVETQGPEALTDDPEALVEEVAGEVNDVSDRARPHIPPAE